MARRLGGLVTPCAVYTVQKKTSSTRFLVWPQNKGRRFEPQNRQLRFDNLDIKITAMISWFGSQNQASDSLLIVAQNTRQDLAACITWNQIGLEFSSLP
jgi:hypothetical protein